VLYSCFLFCGGKRDGILKWNRNSTNKRGGKKKGGGKEVLPKWGGFFFFFGEIKGKIFRGKRLVWKKKRKRAERVWDRTEFWKKGRTSSEEREFEKSNGHGGTLPEGGTNRKAGKLEKSSQGKGKARGRGEIEDFGGGKKRISHGRKKGEVFRHREGFTLTRGRRTSFHFLPGGGGGHRWGAGRGHCGGTLGRLGREKYTTC